MLVVGGRSVKRPTHLPEIVWQKARKNRRIERSKASNGHLAGRQHVADALEQCAEHLAADAIEAVVDREYAVTDVCEWRDVRNGRRRLAADAACARAEFRANIGGSLLQGTDFAWAASVSVTPRSHSARSMNMVAYLTTTSRIPFKSAQPIHGNFEDRIASIVGIAAALTWMLG
jgi:hypothetical protein